MSATLASRKIQYYSSLHPDNILAEDGRKTSELDYIKVLRIGVKCESNVFLNYEYLKIHLLNMSYHLTEKDV